jgi:hypothetical protein
MCLALYGACKHYRVRELDRLQLSL